MKQNQTSLFQERPLKKVTLFKEKTPKQTSLFKKPKTNSKKWWVEEQCVYGGDLNGRLLRILAFLVHLLNSTIFLEKRHEN